MKNPMNVALDLAKYDLPIFPCSQDKRPIIKDWGNAATTDPETIRDWWVQHPDACVGVPTGPRSNIFAIDIDVEVDQATGEIIKDGASNFAALCEQHGTTYEAVVGAASRSDTPRGGLHLRYTWQPGLRNTASRLTQHVDTRGDGGYIVYYPPAPGSPRRTELPTWLATLLLTPRESPAPYPPATSASPLVLSETGERFVNQATLAEMDAVTEAAEGTRNDRLNTAAYSLGQLVGAGLLGSGRATYTLTVAAMRAGLDERETAATITSGLEAGAKSPRPIEPRWLAAEVGEQQPGEPDDDLVIEAVRITPRAPKDEWLWASQTSTEGGYIPGGTLTLLSGDPGIGKTTWALKIAAELSTGALSGSYMGRPSKTLLVCCEDDYATRIGPMLLAHGADLDLVPYLRLSRGGQEIPFTLPRYADQFRELILRERPTLVVFDPFGQVVTTPNTDSYNYQDTYDLIRPLIAVANECGTTVLALMHHNKSADHNGINKLNGSVGLGAAARAVIQVFDRGDDGYSIGVTKMNSGKKAPPLSYEIVSAAVPAEGGEQVTTSRISLLGEDLDWGVSDAELRRRAIEAEKAAEVSEVLMEFSSRYPGGGTRAQFRAVVAERRRGQDRLWTAAQDCGMVIAGDDGKYWVNPLSGAGQSTVSYHS